MKTIVRVVILLCLLIHYSCKKEQDFASPKISITNINYQGRKFIEIYCTSKDIKSSDSIIKDGVCISIQHIPIPIIATNNIISYVNNNCYSHENNPFIISINNLPYTQKTCYVRAFVVTKIGTFYSEEDTFKAVFDSWDMKAPFPGEGREYPLGFSIGGKGYISLGKTLAGYYGALKPIVLLTDLWEYDATFDRWTRKTDFPGLPREGAIVLTIEDKAYIGLGSNKMGSLKDWWEYNPQTDQWTQKANYRGDSAINAVGLSANGRGYVGPSKNNKELWEYDPKQDSWVQKANYLGCDNLTKCSGCIINGNFYIFGYPCHTIYRYDPSVNNWFVESGWSPSDYLFSYQNNIFLVNRFTIEVYDSLNKNSRLCGTTFQSNYPGSHLMVETMGFFTINSKVFLTLGQYSLMMSGTANKSTYEAEFGSIDLNQW